MMLQLQRNDLVVRYVPGKLMYAAHSVMGALATSHDADPELTSDMQVMVHAFVTSLPVSVKRKHSYNRPWQQIKSYNVSIDK